MTDTEKQKKTGHRRWTIFAGIAVTLFVGTLVLLPVLARELGERALRNLGQINASIRDVDFNPFTARMRLTTANGGEAGTGRLDVGEIELQFDWWSLWNRRFLVRSVLIDNAAIHVRRDPESGWNVGHIAVHSETPQQSGRNPWRFGADAIELRNATILYDDGQIETVVHARNLYIKNLHSWSQTSPAEITFSGSINDAPLELEARATPFSVPQKFNGAVQISEFPLQTVAALNTAERFERIEGLASAALDFDLEFRGDERAFRGELAGTAGGNGLLVEGDFGTARGKGLNWTGTLFVTNVASAGDAGAHLTVDASGAARASGLQLALNEPAMRARHELVDAEIDLSLERVDGATRSVLLATARGDDAELEDAETERAFAGLNTYSITGLRIKDGSSVSIEEADVSGLRALERPASEDDDEAADTVAHAGRLTLRNVSLDSGGVLVEAADIAAMQGWFERAPDGEFEAVRLAKAISPERTPPGQTETVSDEDHYRVRVKRLRIHEESSIHFFDQSVKPPVRLNAAPFNLAIEDVDTSDREALARITLDTKLGEYSRIQVEGAVSPRIDEPRAQLEGELSSVDLPPLTGYLERGIGYRLKTGILSAALRMAVADGQLDSETEFTVKNLAVARLDRDETDELTEQIGLPVETAISLLRDKNNDIQLTVPVKGDLDNPEIGLGDAVRTATANALKGGVLSVFAPLRMVANVGKDIALGDALDFRPVEFAGGETRLSAPMESYLENVAKVMQKHPGVRLTLCGLSTRADTAALALARAKESEGTRAPTSDGAPAINIFGPAPSERTEEQLIALAKARSESVKSWLVDRGRIDPDRLFVCDPVVDDAPQSERAPAVDLAL